MNHLIPGSRILGAVAICAAAFTFGAAPLQAQDPIPLPDHIIPTPAGTQTIAAWRSTNRSLVWNETEQGNYWGLNYTTAWESAGTSPYGANFTTVGGSFEFSSTALMYGVLYPFAPGTAQLNVSGYGGPAFSRLILQMDVGFTTSESGNLLDTVGTLNPLLTIGSTSFTIDDIASFNSERYIVDMSDPTEMYSDFNFGGLQMARVTIEWDLNDLGYTGSLDNFFIDLSHGAHGAIGDIQLSVAPIPEPTTWAMLGVAGVALLGMRTFRRKANA